MKNIVIFAMRQLRNYIANFTENLFLHYNKGVVLYSYFSNVLSGCRKLKRLHPHFVNLTNLRMRQPVNKVNSRLSILLTTSQKYISKFTVISLFVNSKKLAI